MAPIGGRPETGAAGQPSGRTFTRALNSWRQGALDERLLNPAAGPTYSWHFKGLGAAIANHQGRGTAAGSSTRRDLPSK
jgi:hypothetical protein